MNALTHAVQYFLNLGPSVMLPVFIFIIALIFRVKPGKALRSGVTIGIGMIGINLVLGLLSDNIGPAAQAMVTRFGFHLTIIDVGWPGVSAGTWAQPISAAIIPLAVIVNIVMLLLKLTKTMDVDIWNYWHFAAAAATALIVTGNFWFALAMAVLYEAACLIFADKTSPMVQKYYGLEDVSFPTGSAVAMGMVGIPIGWVIGKIPGINKIKADPESIQKRFGIFGEPWVMGFVIGAIIAALAGYDVGKIAQVGMNMAGVMFLMPRMVKILMEGLIPISEGAQEFLQSRFKDRKIYIGMDAALSTGSPAALSAGLLLVPITLFLAVVLPGNRVLPFGDLATIPFFVALIVPSRKGNIFQIVLTGTVVMALALLMATDFGSVMTQMMQGVVNTPGGATEMSNLDTGGNLLNWLVLKLSQLWNLVFH
ncbi:PTS galactitol transporter subunit IIC [Propionibacterium sp.]|uniref:PTS galactitol transporter subunit IIC n=1 Tax=Propionibacterium sp. TaxID=1977903 RepID=UPI0039EC4F05